MDIKNAVILITSAGSSIGKMLANHFSMQGAIVLVTDTDLNKLQETVACCDNGQTNVIPCHLPDYSFQRVQRLFDEIEDSLHHNIDVLINYWPSQPIPSLTSQTTSEEFSQTIGQFASPFFTFGQVCAQHMQFNPKSSVIVNMLTYDPETPRTGHDNNASIITGFTKSWSKELRPFNIRVGAIIPDDKTTVSEQLEGRNNWADEQDDLIRNTEYIVSNDYFNGRVIAA